jgi:hypothetical protein
VVGQGGRSDSEEEAEEDVIKQEITSYRAEPEEEDVLKWWRRHKNIPPTLPASPGKS